MNIPNHEKFLQSYNDKKFLDFWNSESENDTELLDLVVSRKPSDKAKLYILLRKIGVGTGLTIATEKFVPVIAKPPKQIVEKPKKVLPAVQQVLDYLSKRTPEEYTFKFLYSPNMPKWKSTHYAEAATLVNKDHLEPFIERINAQMEDAHFPLNYETSPTEVPGNNIQQFFNHLTIDQVGRFLVLERLVTPEELADRETFFNICYEKAQHNHTTLMSVLSEEDKNPEFLSTLNTAWVTPDTTKKDARAYYYYNIAPEVLPNSSKPYDHNSEALKQKYQESFDWYRDQIYLPIDSSAYEVIPDEA